MRRLARGHTALAWLTFALALGMWACAGHFALRSSPGLRPEVLAAAAASTRVVVAGLLTAGSVWLAAAAVLARCAAAIAHRKRRRFCLVAGCLTALLASVPGLVLAAYTFVVLRRAPVKRLFGEAA